MTGLLCGENKVFMTRRSRFNVLQKWDGLFIDVLVSDMSAPVSDGYWRRRADANGSDAFPRSEVISYTPRYSLATYPRQSLTSTCLLTYILRALFCEVARSKFNCTFYLQNDMSARVWRCHDSSSEHIQEHNYSTEFPLYSFPHPIAFSPGAAVAVVARILWVGPSCQWITNKTFLVLFIWF